MRRNWGILIFWWLLFAQTAFADFAQVSLYNETYRANGTQPNNQVPSLIAGGRGAYSKPSWFMAGDGEAALILNDPRASYVNVREAYVGTVPPKTPDGRFQAQFGRKLENWSLLDEQWQLGLWQPRFRWNFLNPDVVGLTGLFVSKETENVRMVAFGSPIFIPELGASYDFNNGQVSSSNRFVALPPNHLSLFGGNLPLNYQLGSFSVVKDIVLHPSAGGMIRVGQSQGIWGKVSYAYEPVNRVMLGYEGYLYLAKQDVEVTLHPRVVYHHLAALEAGYTAPSWKSWLSVLVEHPVKDEVPAAWSTEQILPAVLASASVSVGAFTVSHLYSTGGFAPDQGPLANGTTSLFESRYPYRNATSLQAALGLTGSDIQGLQLAGKGIYEYTVSGILLSMDLIYHYNQHWSAGLGGDAVGSSRGSAPNGGADFMYLYRSDDRIRGKVTYLF